MQKKGTLIIFRYHILGSAGGMRSEMVLAEKAEQIANLHHYGHCEDNIER